MKLSNKDILITGFALLAMFFGAGNLIFPPMLGLQSGDQLSWALLGFIVTGVGLPFLGVTAVAKAGGDLELLANRVHPAFSKIITTISVLCIGPLLAIPRTAATTYEVAIAPVTQFIHPQLALLLTSVAFFAITLFFVLRPTQILDSVGKILTPFMLIFLAIIIYVGVTHPLGTMAQSSYMNPFSQGFLEGYNTMDAIASVIFGMIIVKGIKEKGVNDNNQIARITITAGMIAAAGLCFIYVGLGYIGATTGTLFTGTNHGQMLIFISESLLGVPGRTIIGVVMALACLTTAIGLVASCGEYFSRLTHNRVSYNTVAIITTFISFILANMGLANILRVSVPLLEFVYPIIIVLIMLALLHNLYKGKRAVYVWTVGIIVFYVTLDTLYDLGTSLGINLGLIRKVMDFLPFYHLGLGWLIPAVLTLVLTMVFTAGKSAKA
ncbi:branched-chain amino acid uptake carrier [Desulfitobacterium dehalogenans ATCC 51507]|uniref:Branched-chain amino acid transport system carrier protein n=1 Tax=Desulfitobacterium dehalogenans (strain ATCC 51507 / DSM 9161 / JW/IU-DC1) TaxID=756499 RepID=I4A8B2_DESDJ|nr:branched-chain amino acid transport system II carrier protein [Desulfitobacterium dehalogenans]AFM00197.1 branched-chain amino acid uptake carrier [Desulfitobacterium dehalogenans ATCC 51507]